MTGILSPQYIENRAKLGETAKRLHELTLDIGHQEMAETVETLRQRIDEPFMFVIVGEVKAGKSSFINALLDTGKEVTKVAPQPMTDTVQQIVFGEEEGEVMVTPFLKKIYLPVEILQDIAIVDTPGTNTIVDQHQEITENFVPDSDLIVFVFEAKNPYRQSAWTFFDFIHDEWRKKIIFILQQKDLMEPDDLEVNMKGVAQYAREKNIDKPVVYAVSAKQELDGKKEESGFKAVREYILAHITGGKAPILKLQNKVETAKTINSRIHQGLMDRKKQWEADKAFREDIRETLDKQETKSDKQVNILIENLQAAYDRVTRAKEEELSEGLGFFTLLRRSFAAIFNRNASAKEWLADLTKELETDLNRELKNRLDEGVIDIADSVQQMGQLIDLKIQNSRTLLPDSHEVFGEVAERRTNVLTELRETFRDFLARSENFTDEALIAKGENISPNVATGSGIAVIGVILTALTNGAVFDITGGILTTIGVLFAGVTVGLKKRQVIKEYRKEIDKGRTQIGEEVREKLIEYIHTIREKIDGNFTKFDSLLIEEEKQIESLESRYHGIEEELDGMKSSLSISQ